MRRALLCWICLIGIARAEHLPVRTYTTADGLANNRVDRGTRDARGFLWFATFGGVSRFDGREFVTFGVADGLPASTTFDVVATHDGKIWAVTDGGVAWLDTNEAAVKPRFHAISDGPAYTVTEDTRGIVWVGSEAGLSRVDHGKLVNVSLGEHQPRVLSIAYDARDRSLWMGGTGGLYRRRDDGTVEHYRVAPADIHDDRVFTVALDRTGKLWIAHVGAYVLGIPVTPGVPLTDGEAPLWDVAAARTDWLHFTPKGWARRNVIEDSHGAIWIGTTRDLVRYDHGAFEELSGARTSVDNAMAPCVEDRAGNMWFGSEGGLHRLAPSGPVIFDGADGLMNAVVYGFVQRAGGPLHAIIAEEDFAFAQRDGARFTTVVPYLPRAHINAWGVAQIALLDRDGRWWLATGQGAARYPRVDSHAQLATAQPRIYGVADGLPGRDVLRMYEDRHGDVWLSTMSKTGLARWDRASDRIIAVGDGWPTGVAAAFTEDQQGALWIGYDDGSLVRVRDGVPRVFGAKDQLPGGGLDALLTDRDGHLWVGSDHDGIARIEDPAADALQIRRYTTADGLASDQVMTLLEDAAGQIYIGSTHGIDRLDPRRGVVRHYGMREGLPAEYVFSSVREPSGTLWFGTKKGAVQLPAVAPEPSTPPAIYIAKLTVAGIAQPLPADGLAVVPSLELDPDQDRLDVEFTAPSFDVGAPLRFQYRLDDGAWSTPLADRTVRFAKLAPGHYRFEVRAVLADRSRSSPASLAFVILPPIWVRWWFVLLAAGVVAGAGYALYRWRLAHLLAVERVRSRIASDLHDEIGSSLSRISILSELASRRAAAREDVNPQIDVIGTSARELVDVASDIVWATDPRRDDLGSLIVRLRTFAADVLESRDIRWSLDAPSDPDRIKLDPERRRHLYLVLKEAINNAARHSGAQRVEVAIRATASGLVASVRDDGHGFDEATLARPGNGLTNMRTRAAEAGGTLDIRQDAGTEITLRL